MELLDPIQVRRIAMGVDAVIFCYPTPSLNEAFLFWVVESPTEGRVKIEGMINSLEGLVGEVGETR